MRYIIFVVLFISAVFTVKADFKKPDFAYPQTVEADAEKVLREATGADAGLTRLKAVMEIVKAKCDVNPDSLAAMAGYVGAMSRNEKDAAVKALFMMYRAQLASMNGADRDSIQAYVDGALEGIAGWGNGVITKYDEVLSVTAETKTFYPYLRDFMFSKAIALCPMKASEFIDRAINLAPVKSTERAVWLCERNNTANSLFEAYSGAGAGIGAGYILYRLSQVCGRENEAQCISLLKEYLANNHNNLLTDALQSCLKRLTSPSMEIIVPEVGVPGEDFDVKCVHSYTAGFDINIYKVTNPNGNKRTKKKIATFTFDTDKDAVSDTAVLTTRLTTPGNYEVTAEIRGVKKSTYQPSAAMIVTNYIPLGIKNGNSGMLSVSNIRDGSPSAGVEAYLANENGKQPASPGGTSDKNGMIPIVFSAKTNQSDGGMITLVEKGNPVVFNEGMWGNTWTQTGSTTEGAVFVSRPVYHPGDTVGWSAVIVEKNYSKLNSSLVKEKNFRAVLYDANYQPVDTVEGLTDRFGRFSGSFVIPTDRLTGRYRIEINGEKRFVCSAGVMVSDFKMPVFEITDLRVEESDSTYTVSGKATRYSGAAIADGRVDIRIQPQYFWWMPDAFQGDETIEGEGTTAADGSFSVVIKRSDKSGSPRSYRCDVTVTTLNAETADSSISFRTGKPLMLSGGLSADMFDACEDVVLPVKSVNLNMEFKSIELTWRLKNQSTEGQSYEGVCKTDSTGLSLRWSHVTPGRYSLDLIPADTAICNTLNLGKIWIYSRKNNQVPEGLRLVVPNTGCDISGGNLAEVTFGVGQPAYVYVFGTDTDGKVSATVKEYAPGFHTEKVRVDAREQQRVTIAMVADGKVYSSIVTVRRITPDRRISIKGESMRDKLTPGGVEKWILRICDSKGKGVESALTATLYNRALGALNPNYAWPNLSSLLMAPQRTVAQQFVSPQFGISRFSVSNLYPIKGITTASPEYLYVPENLIFRGGIRYARKSAMMEESRAMSANTMMAAGVADFAVEEEVAADDAESLSTETGSIVKYREAEVQQAFWMPELTTDKDGTAILKFTMPNAIGSWDLKAAAWTDEMQAASFMSTLRSSKPVMVEPSLPRFLRRGDKALIGATVMNNTDSTAAVTVITEIFEPLTMTVVKADTCRVQLAEGAQTVVYTDVTAGLNLSSLGYRVSASASGFTDGEQAAVPILEAATLAIDSEVFYIDAQQPTFTTIISGNESEDGIVAIEYCQNPIWDAVKSLPALYASEPRTAPAAASMAFAALSARDLYRKFPEIKEVLEIWKSTPSDSSLVSDLEKNEDLKLKMLAQTPFVGAANANSENMQRLATTFDKTIIDREIRTATAKLKSLQKADGGFAWGSWSKESSAFITYNVLMNIGRVKNKALLNEEKELEKIIDRAFAYLDGTIKNGKEDYAYTMLYSLYQGRRPSTTAGQRSIDATVQNILANWKGHYTSQKAVDALILEKNGNRNSALSIMQSIKQFAQNSPRKGTVFPSVNTVDAYIPIMEAFAELEPTSPLLDGMRKWLVLSTQSTSDLGSWNPTELISAILTTGSRWTAEPSRTTADVMVAGREIAISRVEAATGAFSIRLEPRKNDRAVTFTCPPNTTGAYGSVVTIAEQPLDKVKARSTEGLMVERTVLKETAGKWSVAQEIKKGDRLKVKIELTVPRDMEYVTVTDNRAATFEPVEQMPGWRYQSGASLYCEFNDESTNFFAGYLPKGNYVIEYEVTAAYSGDFASGTATVQSQYAPELTARSSAERIEVLQ